jgi:hypothetical protein
MGATWRFYAAFPLPTATLGTNPSFRYPRACLVALSDATVRAVSRPPAAGDIAEVQRGVLGPLLYTTGNENRAGAAYRGPWAHRRVRHCSASSCPKGQ